MKKYIYLILGIILGATILGGIAQAQVANSQWRLIPTSTITTVIPSYKVQIPVLANGTLDCVYADASGTLQIASGPCDSGTGSGSSTINGFTGTVFTLGPGSGLTSTVSNGSTTFILNLSAGCSGSQFVANITPTGTIYCGVPSGGASSTNVYGANGVSVSQVGINATATLNTAYAAAWSALETFAAGLTVNGNVKLASTTSAIVLTDSNGNVLAYGGSNVCSAGTAATAISATGTVTCSAVVNTVNGSSGAVTISSSSLGVVWPTVNGNTATNYIITGDNVGITSTVSGATTTLKLINTGNWAGTWQGTNSTTYYLTTNPSNFTTTTIQSVLNAISSTNPITYSTSTGIIGWTNSNGYITLASLSSTAPLSYNPATGIFSCPSCVTAIPASIASINGATSSAQFIVGGAGISVSTSNPTTTVTNTGVTSFTGQGCVTAANSTGSVALSVTCISGNQSITFTIAGDATGTASGTTSITDTITVTGLNGKALPANTTGTLQYIGGAWKINLATSSLGVYDSSGNVSSYIGSSCGGSQFVTGISATGTVSCGTPSGAGTVTQLTAGAGISLTPTNPITTTGTITNIGVTSFTGANCVTAANSTGSVTLTVTCISANQSITWTGTGDATGTGSGATSITVPMHVVAIQGVAVTSTAPTSNQVFEYNSTNHDWEPTTIPGATVYLASTTPWTLGGIVIASTTGSVTTIASTTYYLSTNPSGYITSGSLLAANGNCFDNSGQIATDQFTQNAINCSMATVPLTIASGTYSFDSQGTGGGIGYTTTGGAITAITNYYALGSGYAVGDIITPVAGNNDAILRVTAVSSGQPTAVQILYGGTGYVNNSSVIAGVVSSAPFTYLLSGALTANVTFIMTHGTYLSQSNQWIVANNTTGASTVTICVAGATDACAGGRTVVAPQGTTNNREIIIQTDGELNVDLAGVVSAYDLLNSSTFYLTSNPSNYISTAVTSINGDTTAAQKITSTGPITTSTAAGVTTIGCASCLTTSTASTTYVPYTGATGNVNLGSNSISVGGVTNSGAESGLVIANGSGAQSAYAGSAVNAGTNCLTSVSSTASGVFSGASTACSGGGGGATTTVTGVYPISVTQVGASATTSLITTSTTKFYIDGNRTDTYTADGSPLRPYKTVSAAIAASVVPTTCYSYDITPLDGGAPYVDGAPDTFPSCVYINGNQSTLVEGTGGTFPGSFDIYDLTYSGTLTANDTSTASIHQLQNGVQSGAFSCAGNCLLNNMALPSSTAQVTIKPGALTNFNGDFIQTNIVNQGTLNLNDDEIMYGGTNSTGWAVYSSSTGSNVYVNGATVIISNAATQGIYMNNGATSTPNAVSNLSLIVNTSTVGSTLTSGSANTLISGVAQFTNMVGTFIAPSGTVWANGYTENQSILSGLSTGTSTVTTGANIQSYHYFPTVAQLAAGATCGTTTGVTDPGLCLQDIYNADNGVASTTVVYLASAPSSSPYSTSHGVTFGTLAHWVDVIGQPGGGTMWNYTAATGTVFTINDCYSNAKLQATQMQDFEIQGPSATTTNGGVTGIMAGGTNGACATNLNDLTIYNTNIGLNTASNTYMFSLENSIIKGTTQALVQNSPSNSGEGMTYLNDRFNDPAWANSGGATSSLKYIYLASNSSPSTIFEGGSMDNAQLYVEAGNYVTLIGVHHENPSIQYPSYDFIKEATSSYTMILEEGGVYVNDQTSTRPNQFINAGGNYVDYGTSILNNGVASTVTSFADSAIGSTNSVISVCHASDPAPSVTNLVNTGGNPAGAQSVTGCVSSYAGGAPQNWLLSSSGLNTNGPVLLNNTTLYGQTNGGQYQLGVNATSSDGTIVLYVKNSSSTGDAQAVVQNGVSGAGAYIRAQGNSNYVSMELLGTSADWKFGQFSNVNFSVYDGTDSKTPFVITQNAPTNSLTISAAGVVQVGTGPLEDPGGVNYTTTTPSTLAGTYLTTSGSQLTVSSTLASSSVTFNFYTPTTTAGYSFAEQYTSNAKTLAYIDCGEQASSATTTWTVGYATTVANGIAGTIGTNLITNLSCTSAGYSTTTFNGTSTVPANSWVIAKASSTAGSPVHTTIDIAGTKK